MYLQIQSSFWVYAAVELHPSCYILAGRRQHDWLLGVDQRIYCSWCPQTYRGGEWQSVILLINIQCSILFYFNLYSKFNSSILTTCLYQRQYMQLQWWVHLTLGTTIECKITWFTYCRYSLVLTLLEKILL